MFLYYKCFNTVTKRQIYLSHYFVQKSGAIPIKIGQHVKMFAHAIQSNNEMMKYFIDLFNTLYEDVDIHDFNYSSMLFQNEYDKNILDIFELDAKYKIKSGSVAQVYKAKIKNNIFNTHCKTVAIKIVHPDFNIQLKFMYPIIFIYNYLYKKNLFKGTIFNIVDLQALFIDLCNQNDMTYEYKNIQYFYDIYKNNKFLNIPYPISCSKNILIMEYIDAVDINTVYKNNASTEYKLMHVLWIIVLFTRENYASLDLLHADLHDYNWKIKSNDYSKVVIFDYGLVINKRSKYKTDEDFNTFNDRITKIMYGLDNKDLDVFIENIIHFITFGNNDDIEKIKIEFRNEFIKASTEKDTTSNIVNTLLIFSINNTFKFEKIIINIIVIIVSLSRHLETFIYPKTCKSDMILTHYISQYEFCSKNKVFDSAKDQLAKYYLTNERFLNTTVKKTRFNNLLTSTNYTNNINYDV